MQRALAASIGVAEKWMTKENVLWLPFFGNFRQRNHPHVSAPALFLPVSTNVFDFTRILSLAHLFYALFYSWSKHKRIRTVRQYSGSLGLAHPRGMYYNGKEGREELSLLITSYNTGRACHISISSASRRARHKSYALCLATCYNKS